MATVSKQEIIEKTEGLNNGARLRLRRVCCVPPF